MAGLQVLALSFAALAVVSGQDAVGCDGGCVDTYAQCAGKGVDGVLDCCKSDAQCMGKNKFYAQCRPFSDSDVDTFIPIPPRGGPRPACKPGRKLPTEAELPAEAPTVEELPTDESPTDEVAAVAGSGPVGANIDTEDNGGIHVEPPPTKRRVAAATANDDNGGIHIEPPPTKKRLTAGTATATDTDDDTPQVNQSSAKCIVISIGDSEVNSKNAIAEATADASAFICNGETDKTAESIATATASAFAVAVASASVECELVGDASVQVEAKSSAVAAGNVWVKAYADAFASAGDCDKCEAYALSFGYIEKEVFLKAVAEAEVKLAAYTEPGGPPLIVKVNDYKSEVQVAVARAFANALAGAADYKNTDGCLAWVNAGGCIWTPESEDPDSCFECEAVVVSAGAIKEIDALAEANTGITETAEAVATAYAELWAGAYVCQDKCSVEVDAVVEAVGSILVQAATDAWAGVCVEGTGSWTVASLTADIESSSLCALATASVDAISIAPSTCLVGGIVYADVSTCPEP